MCFSYLFKNQNPFSDFQFQYFYFLILIFFHYSILKAKNQPFKLQSNSKDQKHTPANQKFFTYGRSDHRKGRLEKQKESGLPLFGEIKRGPLFRPLLRENGGVFFYTPSLLISLPNSTHQLNHPLSFFGYTYRHRVASIAGERIRPDFKDNFSVFPALREKRF